MIGYVMVGTNDLNKAINFYDKILKSLNLKRVETDSEYAAYASMENPAEIEFMSQNLLIKKKLPMVMELKFHLLQTQDK